MGKSFRAGDLDQSLLFPPSLHDWLPDHHLTRFVADVVNVGAIPARYRGRFGWHNLRHSLATFFAANGISLPIIQSMMRHAKPTTTAIYTHRVNATQGKCLEAINVRAAVA
jgi:site-specific recombinase XerD